MPERLIVRAHNHYCGVRDWRGGRIVTVGSVGLPLDGTLQAQFTVIERGPAAGDEWRIEHHAVPYDVAAAVRRFRESGYLNAADLVAGIKEGHATAVLAASIFHFGTYSIAEAKRYMADHGIAMRLD